MADTSFDPASMAQQLATAYTSGMQTRLDGQVKDAQATSTGLTKMQSALKAFDTALTAMSTKKGVLARSATLSDTSIGTASASAAAQPGNYSFFVEQLATAHQVAFNNLPAVPAAGVGTLNVQLAGGTGFDVNFATADQDGDGTLSQTEIARSINQSPDNKGTVTATVITVGATKQLVLSAASTGAGGQITLNTNGMSANPLKTALSAGTTLSTGKDAIVWLGAQGSGIPLQQGSNTFEAVEGVSITFTKAMTPGTAPAILTVASDDTTTASNVQAFVDAFNTLKKTLDDLTATADPDAGTPSAAFASDTSVRTLRSRLNELVRQDFGGLRLQDFGMSSDRDGNLTLDKAKLTKGLAAHPDGLDQVFGKASLTASSGVLGSIDKYLDVWLNNTNGQIKRRQDSLSTIQKSNTARQTTLDDQFNTLYKRYLAQFTQLQTLQQSMSQNSSLFDTIS